MASGSSFFSSTAIVGLFSVNSDKVAAIFLPVETKERFVDLERGVAAEGVVASELRSQGRR